MGIGNDCVAIFKNGGSVLKMYFSIWCLSHIYNYPLQMSKPWINKKDKMTVI